MAYLEDFERRRKREEDFMEWMKSQEFTSEQRRIILEFCDNQAQDSYSQGADSAEYAAATQD